MRLRLKTSQSETITEALAAASAAATAMAASMMTDIVTRLTGVEMQQSVPPRRLPGLP